MKTILSFVLGFLLAAAIFSGQTANENTIPMDQVTKIEATSSGVMFRFSDGTGYWWEYGKENFQ